MAYSIAAARDSGCFDEVMVSTDDSEIAAVARDYGAAVPFERSARTATDHATTAQVLVEVLNQYAQRGKAFEFACCIYPTAPLVTGESIRSGYAALTGSKAPGLLPVCRFSYPIQRALRLTDGRVSLFNAQYLHSRSQDLEPAYHDAGQFYWIRVDAFMRSENLLAEGVIGLVLPESQVQDIDNEEDWKIAELKYRLLQGFAVEPHTR